MNTRKRLACDDLRSDSKPLSPAKSRGKTKATPRDIGIDTLLLGVEPVSPTKKSSVDELTKEKLVAACEHLRQRDEKLAPLIDLHGPPERLIAKGPNCFATLSKSICFQQLATNAAAKIFERVLETCGCAKEGVLNAKSCLETSAEDLCAAGLSKMKASYIHDLSRHFSEGMLSDDLIFDMTPQELHTSLTKVKGLGPWSVDMHAMFHLGRPDVLPLGDLGVKKGMQHLYGLKGLPNAKEMEAVAEKWKPFRSVGSYYMWRVDVPKVSGKGKKKKS